MPTKTTKAHSLQGSKVGINEFIMKRTDLTRFFPDSPETAFFRLKNSRFCSMRMLKKLILFYNNLFHFLQNSPLSKKILHQNVFFSLLVLQKNAIEPEFSVCVSIFLMCLCIPIASFSLVRRDLRVNLKYDK